MVKNSAHTSYEQFETIFAGDHFRPDSIRGSIGVEQDRTGSIRLTDLLLMSLFNLKFKKTWPELLIERQFSGHFFSF